MQITLNIMRSIIHDVIFVKLYRHFSEPFKHKLYSARQIVDKQYRPRAKGMVIKFPSYQLLNQDLKE